MSAVGRTGGLHPAQVHHEPIGRNAPSNPTSPTSICGNLGDLEEHYEEFWSSEGKLRQVRVLDRDNVVIRDIDFFHERGGGHAGIHGTHTHEYRYNVNPKTEQLNCVRGTDTKDCTVRPFRLEDLPEKYHEFVQKV